MVRKVSRSSLLVKTLLAYLLLGLALASSAEEVSSKLLSLAKFDHPVRLFTVVDSEAHSNLTRYQSLDMGQRMEATELQQLLRDTEKPAALFIERQVEQRVLHLVFFERGAENAASGIAEQNVMHRARRVFSQVISSSDVSTLDSLELIWNAEQSTRVQLAFTQTSLPSENDRNFMPGPPLRFYFQYDRGLGHYRRIED
ncbi:MAG: hypothetical protein CL693_16885 [Cellvibrionaceae bacterium]|nr:hypothetical protein [Cellvibrionaceae bacterium]|tara:strand:- start:2480 stop:3076 length:597 start_codon:yes stop_codon:yes gene_type:complete